MEWRPISTAPKDGTYILAYPALLSLPLVIVWDIQRLFWRVTMTDKEPPFTPKHWMPLPEPPPPPENGG